MCISPGNFSVFCLFAKGGGGVTDDPCKYKKDTKSCNDFFLFSMRLSKFTITTCCGCENQLAHLHWNPTVGWGVGVGGVWEHCHALLSQHYTTTIPTLTLAVKARGNHAHFRTMIRLGLMSTSATNL